MGAINIHFLKALIRHYAVATRIDVLHSPFVFELYTQCIAPKNKEPYHAIEKYRNALLHNNKSIHYQDYGASANSRTVSVKQLAKNHLKPPRIAQILHKLIEYKQYTSILELGTSLGISTCYLALPEKSHVTTMEGSKEVWQEAQNTFKTLKLNHKISSIQGTFDDCLPDILNQKPQYQLIFIDGNHSYEATIRYVKMLEPYLHPDGLMILDDIYWSAGMTQAWNELIPDFTVSIDLFFIGILSKRKGQAKENFKLRVF